jgi:type III secretion system FlhB-like substrate exporter
MDEALPQRVVGLSYEQQKGLPRVVLKAAGPITDDLLAHSLREDGPRVIRNAALLEQLYRLPVDAAIDPSLFRIVAALLAHVLAVNEQISQRRNGDTQALKSTGVEST